MSIEYKSTKVEIIVNANHHTYKCDACDKPEESEYELLPLQERVPSVFWDTTKSNADKYVVVNGKDFENRCICLECWDEMYHAEK